MGYGDVLFYGIIQGLTEFLPISSSAHLAFLPYVLKLEDPGVAFDLLMHVGTALAVIIYFRRDICHLLDAGWSFLRGKEHRHFPWLQNFFFSTLASLVFILFFYRFFLDYARIPALIIFNLAFFGILMWVVDRFAKSGRWELEKKKSISRTVAIGLAQALAIFPGVSRSGVTLTMARALGIGRLEATRYSFLLSLPLILAGMVKKLPEIERIDPLVSCLGILCSFVVGLVTIHFFLTFFNRWGLAPFSLYRIALSGLLLFVIPVI